jgi:hypothetical protein
MFSDIKFDEHLERYMSVKSCNPNNTTETTEFDLGLFHETVGSTTALSCDNDDDLKLRRKPEHKLIQAHSWRSVRSVLQKASCESSVMPSDFVTDFSGTMPKSGNQRQGSMDLQDRKNSIPEDVDVDLQSDPFCA